MSAGGAAMAAMNERGKAGKVADLNVSQRTKVKELKEIKEKWKEQHGSHFKSLALSSLFIFSFSLD
jgi:hypothetical protein